MPSGVGVQVPPSALLPFGEVVQVFAIVLIPLAIGMFVRYRRPPFAARMERPVRISSAVIWPSW